MTTAKMERDQYVERLKHDIEEQLHIYPEVSSDFDKLYSALCTSGKDMLSISTLKRIWGYIPGSETPRISSLDILTRSLGYESFRAFVKHCDEEWEEPSSFMHSGVMCVHKLDEGDTLEVCWKPDRVVRMRYLGDFSFLVYESFNSKLQEGMVVRCSLLIPGQPIYADVYVDGDTDGTPRPFVGGKQGGITVSHC